MAKKKPVRRPVRYRCAICGNLIKDGEQFYSVMTTLLEKGAGGRDAGDGFLHVRCINRLIRKFFRWGAVGSGEGI